mmetsp:Transcript_22863/g.42946  ORF Transcript_22863/g.42946 Transcript_22863/m.42946 type:complete len:264 (-) Transcript_22863:2436-3227(-)
MLRQNGEDIGDAHGEAVVAVIRVPDVPVLLVHHVLGLEARLNPAEAEGGNYHKKVVELFMVAAAQENFLEDLHQDVEVVGAVLQVGFHHVDALVQIFGSVDRRFAEPCAFDFLFNLALAIPIPIAIAIASKTAGPGARQRRKFLDIVNVGQKLNSLGAVFHSCAPHHPHVPQGVSDFRDEDSEAVQKGLSVRNTKLLDVLDEAHRSRKRVLVVDIIVLVVLLEPPLLLTKVAPDVIVEEKLAKDVEFLAQVLVRVVDGCVENP